MLPNVTQMLFDAYCKCRFENQNTKHHYEPVIDEVCRFAHKEFHRIGKTEATLFFKSLEEKYALNTIAFHKRCLSSFGDFIYENAEELGLTTYYNPFKSEINANVIVDPYSLPTIPVLNRLLKYSEQRDTPLWIALLLVIANGLTMAELLALQVDSLTIDKTRQLYYLSIGNRRVLITKEQAQIYEAYLSEHNCSKAFFQYQTGAKAGHPILARTFQRKIEALNDYLGYQQYTFRDIRNWHITYVLKFRCPKVRLADALGVTSKWLFRFNWAIELYQITDQLAVEVPLLEEYFENQKR